MAEQQVFARLSVRFSTNDINSLPNARKIFDKRTLAYTTEIGRSRSSWIQYC